MNEIEKTDVCIIGSGPSGAATSIMLSKLNIPHCIIDKATFPRDKTCGDGLILYAYKSLKTLGEDLFNDFLNHPKFIHSKRIKLNVSNTLNLNFRESKDRNMVISYAKRIDFDDFLVKNLSKEYAKTYFGNGVKTLKKDKNGILIKLKDGKEIFTKLVVGADGANSIVSRKLAKNKVFKNLTSTFVSTYFKDVNNLPSDNRAEIRLIYKKMLLFFYIFPLSDGQVNVSLGGRSDHIKKYDINLIKEIEEIIKSNKNVKDIFLNASKVKPWRGWTIPFHFENHNIIGDNFLLVGDAAGLANAFYKEGIGTGMMSGIIAAKNIEKCIKNNNYSLNELKNYENDLKREFKKLLKFSHFTLRIAKFKALFYSIIFLFKKSIEARSYSLIKKRSY